EGLDQGAVGAGPGATARLERHWLGSTRPGPPWPAAGGRAAGTGPLPPGCFADFHGLPNQCCLHGSKLREERTKDNDFPITWRAWLGDWESSEAAPDRIA